MSLFVIVFWSLMAPASDPGDSHGEPAVESKDSGEHTQPSGEHVSSENEGHGEGAKAPQSPWLPFETKVTELQAKIKTKEANILQLLEEKNKLPNNSPHLKSTVASIVKEHKELRELAAEYQKNLSMLKFRFPERNVKSGRRYDRIEVKSLEEMELALGVDGKLNRNLKKMRLQFQAGDDRPASHRDPASATPQHSLPANQKSKSITEEGSIILQK